MQTEYRSNGNRQRLPIRWGEIVHFRVPLTRPAHNRLLQWNVWAAVNPRLRLCVLAAVGLLLALGSSGCAAPSVRQQRLVAKANMTFSEAAAFSYNSPRLLGQLATGIASTGGAQNSGCTSCR